MVAVYAKYIYRIKHVPEICGRMCEGEGWASRVYSWKIHIAVYMKDTVQSCYGQVHELENNLSEAGNP